MFQIFRLLEVKYHLEYLTTQVPDDCKVNLLCPSGEKLLRFCLENSLIIINTLFRQHSKYNGRNQIDYICTQQRWKIYKHSHRLSQEQTATQPTNYLLQISRYNLKKWWKKHDQFVLMQVMYRPSAISKLKQIYTIQPPNYTKLTPN